MALIHIGACPVCAAQAILPVITVQDFSVSKQVFQIWECSVCSFRFTQDIPDQHAIAPYYKSENYISHSDTSKGIINRLYHIVRRFTLRGKRKLVQQESGLKAGRLLDVGAGTGSFLQEMKQAGWQVTGLEPDPDARKIAQQKAGLPLLEPDSLFQLPGMDYDVITLWHVLEHVHSLHDYLSQFHALLKENGCLLIAVPNYRSGDAAHYDQYWAAYDVPRHLYHFSPKAMRTLVEKHGFRVQRVLPMWFDSFYVSMLSETYKNGSSRLPVAFWQGLRSNLAALGNQEKASSLIHIIKKIS
jgi:2-polyprenyl-3-methyl-5-hydroxy-6-metoxy-1,4-benzoquinol methylase